MMGTTLLVLALASALAGMICGGAMVGHIARRGEKVNAIFINFYFFKYVGRYRAITREETGRVGPLFLPFVLCMNLALLLAVVVVATGV